MRPIALAAPSVAKLAETAKPLEHGETVVGKEIVAAKGTGVAKRIGPSLTIPRHRLTGRPNVLPSKALAAVRKRRLAQQVPAVRNRPAVRICPAARRRPPVPETPAEAKETPGPARGTMTRKRPNNRRPQLA